jgi:hypothetical protein
VVDKGARTESTYPVKRVGRRSVINGEGAGVSW